VQRLPGVVDLSVRILHVTDAFPPERGGVERVVENLAAQQAAGGWRVTVLTKSVAGAPAEERRDDGVRVLRYAYPLRPTPRRYAGVWRATRDAASKLLPEIDLAHFHLTLSAQGALSALAGRVPTVYTFYGPWHAESAVEAEELRARRSLVYGWYLDALLAAQKRMQRRLLLGVDRVAMLSEFSRSWLRVLAPSRADDAVIVPGGIDADRFLPAETTIDPRAAHGLPADAFVILTVRRLAARMGLDLLLAAVATLHREGKNIACLIGGSGPLRDDLERQARQLGIDDRVRFLGFVPDDELPAVYHAADLFVVPTRAEENFGLIVLEAAACGTPVAATPAGSLPEVMRAVQSPYLAADVSATALVETIRRAMSDGPRAKQAAQAVASTVRETFGWPRIAAQTAALYRTLGVG